MSSSLDKHFCIRLNISFQHVSPRGLTGTASEMNANCWGQHSVRVCVCTHAHRCVQNLDSREINGTRAVNFKGGPGILLL